LRNNRTPVFTVHLDRLAHNLDILCAHANKTPDQIIAVVKDNGYGIGAFPMASLLANHGVNHFAVAAFDEALFLRDKGIEGTILLLGLSDSSQIEIARTHKITLSIVDPVQFRPFSENNHLQNVHLLIDTGMHRNGIRHDEILSGKFDTYLDSLGSKITGLYTHYHSSDQTDQQSVEEQHQLFEQVKAYLADRGIRPSVCHCSNSGAVVYGTVSDSEFVRFGIAFHGIGQEICPELEEVSEIHSVVTAVRTVYPGEGISYNHLFVAQETTKVATVPIGYGDGYSRSFTGNSSVIINGIKYPILARVTMDYVVVAVGNDRVNVGDQATLLGTDGNESILITELASAIHTIPYEILCTCGAAMDHRYCIDGETVSMISRPLF